MTVDQLTRDVEAEKSLSRDLERYAGQWVAVNGHRVEANADTLEALLGEIENIEVEGVFQVPAEAGVACFF